MDVRLVCTIPREGCEDYSMSKPVLSDLHRLKEPGYNGFGHRAVASLASMVVVSVET